eukprot:m.1335122 g.1335122  ORF g.1335122 m.1335122 type:complete len:835 (-) comp24879_c1_seq7:998-3502(-)
MEPVESRDWYLWSSPSGCRRRWCTHPGRAARERQRGGRRWCGCAAGRASLPAAGVARDVRVVPQRQRHWRSRCKEIGRASRDRQHAHDIEHGRQHCQRCRLRGDRPFPQSQHMPCDPASGEEPHRGAGCTGAGRSTEGQRVSAGAALGAQCDRRRGCQCAGGLSARQHNTTNIGYRRKCERSILCGVAAYRAQRWCVLVSICCVVALWQGLDAAGSTAVCSALQQHPALHTLALSGNTLGAGGGTAVGALLRHNAVLRKVQLSRADLGDAGAVGVAEGLAANRMLRVLYLRENGVGDTGAAALANALRSNMKIEWLHLKHNVITDDGGMAFVGAYTSTAGLVAVVDLDFNACSQDVYHRVVEARKHNRSLIEDSEFGGDRGPSGADASLPLEQSSAPRSPFMDRATIIAALSERAVEFDPAETTEALRALHAVHVAERGMVDPQTRMRGATALNDDEQVFANAHSWQQDLIEWDVSDRGITDTECTVLCNLVARSITTVVYLQSNSLTDAACADLARMLSTNRSLEKLFLNQNRITERGARDIAAALGSNTALQELYLHDNAIDDAGMMNLARALARNSTLTALSLDGNPGGAAAAQAVVSMLETNRGLRQLNVSRIHLGDTGGEAIAAALENKNSTVLEALYCSDCGIGADAMRRIDAVLHRNARYRQHWHSVERVVWEIHTDGCARSKGMSMGVVGWCCIHECMVCEADRAMCLPAVQHQGRARLHASARSASGRGQRCVAPQRPRCGRACVRGAGVGTARARCHLHPVPAEQRRRRCGAANTVLRAAPSSAHHMALPGQQRHRRRRRDTSRGVSRREPHHLACVPRTQPHR